ncbi:hypothetical protein Gxy13693_071_005 [Komagataeibacter xylinus NBRC 13693]|uniref:Uncharacterized protein n=1 Tax=Komagataeibacter xylinus NBRC 13693 TaxID=1234668 RepID=A0A0D6QBL7_KOMXY|nr:hypothetical protein Gxy13693_071_005 [Komagataeibacter xylinus NBRC 13693]
MGDVLMYPVPGGTCRDDPIAPLSADIPPAGMTMTVQKKDAPPKRDAEFRDWETLWCHEIHSSLTSLMDNSFPKNT